MGNWDYYGLYRGYRGYMGFLITGETMYMVKGLGFRA